ncbi:taste receptor type 2 member 140-like [Dendropsophus ebraccatus]|uniref:taste receptor type 2 member 140-like n=1 Tax=Dendropsophus ebraccatus TaxID=150705 RepID=UPI00383125DD
MAVILSIIGVLINGFIVAVNLIDWLKRKTISHIDQIIIVLGVSRICFHASSFLYTLLDVLFLSQNFLIHLYVIKIILTFFNHFSFWVMTLLSVVFCLKISNFHHLFLLRLKIITTQKVAHVIVVLAMFSICYIFLIFLIEHIEFPKDLMRNVTSGGSKIPQGSAMLLFLFLLGNSVPSIVFCTSSALMIVSLSCHIHRMKLNETPTSNLDTYYNVIKFMTLFLTYYVIITVICVMVIYSHFFYSLDIIWVYITVNIFPNLHSTCLVLWTTKLRERFYKIFQCLSNRQI